MNKAPTVLEIVRLPSGEYAMRRHGESEPLMTLALAEGVQQMLQEKGEEVARSMLLAGAHMLSEVSLELSANRMEEEEHQRPRNAPLH